MKTTDYGLRYSLGLSIDLEWSEYDKNIAQSQLCDFGFIIVGEDGAPIDNELDIECIVQTLTL